MENSYKNVRHQEIIQNEDIEILHSILTKIGMIREGILKNRLINDKGEKIDRYIYSILKEEWEENKN